MALTLNNHKNVLASWCLCMKIKKAKISIVAGYNMERFKELFFKGGKQAKQKIARVLRNFNPKRLIYVCRIAKQDLRLMRSFAGYENFSSHWGTHASKYFGIRMFHEKEIVYSVESEPQSKTKCVQTYFFTIALIMCSI